MSLFQFIHGGASASVVALPDNSFTTISITGTVYSGVKFAADGKIYERQKAGGWSNIGTWLLNGTNSDFYINRGTPSSALTTDAGAAALVLSSDRVFDVQQATVGTNETTIDFDIENVGTTVLASNTYTFRAIKAI